MKKAVKYFAIITTFLIFLISIFTGANVVVFAEYNSAKSQGFETIVSENIKVENSQDYPFVLENDHLKSTNQTVGNSSSSISFKFLGMGTLSFKYKISTEERFDKLTITIDDVEMGVFSGKVDWVEESKTFSEKKEHIITFNYKKDGSMDSGDDTVYIKDVVWTLDSTKLATNVNAYLNNGSATKIENNSVFTKDYQTEKDTEFYLTFDEITDQTITLEYNDKTYSIQDNKIIIPKLTSSHNKLVISVDQQDKNPNQTTFYLNIINIPFDYSLVSETEIVNNETNPWQVEILDNEFVLALNVNSALSSSISTSFSTKSIYRTLVKTQLNNAVVNFYVNEVLKYSLTNSCDWSSVDFPNLENTQTNLRIEVVSTSSENSVVYLKNLHTESGLVNIQTSINNETMGSVSGMGEYEIPDQITLTATPKGEYGFMYWLEDEKIVSYEQEYSFMAEKSRTLKAMFGEKTQEVTYNLNGTTFTNYADITLTNFERENGFAIKVSNMSSSQKMVVEGDKTISAELRDDYLVIYDFTDCGNSMILMVEEENKASRRTKINFTFTDIQCPFDNITNDSTYEWGVVNKDGHMALRSSNRTSKTVSSFSFVANKTGLLTFDYFVSSEAKYDKLVLSVNGEKIYEFSGFDGTWTHKVAKINNGDTISFSYSKDSSGDKAEDCAYVANINITSEESIFAGVTGENTSSSPYDFSSSLEILDSIGLTYQYYLENETAKTQLFLKAFDGLSVSYAGVNQNAENGVYAITLNEKGKSVVTLTYNSGVVEVVNCNSGINGGTITSGLGTKNSPYLVENETQLKEISLALDGYFKLTKDITISSAFNNGITSEKQFAGSLDGNNHYINFSNIESANSLFNYTNGATISNLTIKNYKSTSQSISGTVVSNATNTTIANVNVENSYIIASNVAGGIVGKAISGVVVENCSMTGYLKVKNNGTSNGCGGVVGRCDSQTGIVATNCVVGTETTIGQDSTKFEYLAGNESNVGGLSGAGGNFYNCTSFATINGFRFAGGLIGGYSVSSSFENCFFGGKLMYNGKETSNYPYNGIINGYGAWSSITNTDSGQLLNISFTSSVGVEEVTVHNCDKGYTIDGTSTGTSGQFKVFAKIGNSSASSAVGGLLSETSPNGITGNYGGVCVMFKMSDGTIKYVFTLDKLNKTFNSKFTLNLDNIKSYTDNFASMQIDETIGTTTYLVDGGISIWGTALVSNSEDFEHLAIRINGAVETTIGGHLYNTRSISTLSIKLLQDVVLSSSFTGIGMSEMHPYRGSIYGNNKSITLNLNSNGYGVGLISFWTEQTYTVAIENLTVYGEIKGTDRVGIVGVFDGYSRSGKYSFSNVVNYANITATNRQAGFVGYVNAQNSIIGTYSNCTNYGNVSAGNGAGSLIGNATEHTGCQIKVINCINYGTITGSNSGAFAGAVKGITFEGLNKNYGKVASKLHFASSSTTNGLDKVKSYYSITFKGLTESDSIYVNSNLYNTNHEGKVFVDITSSDGKSYSIPSLNYKNSNYKNAVNISSNDTLSSTITKVAKSVELYEGNVYEKLGNSNQLVLKAVVTYYDNTTEILDLILSVTLNKNIVYKGVTLSLQNYSFTSQKDLIVISQDVLDYLKEYNEFDELASITTQEQNQQFSTKADLLKQKYDVLVSLQNQIDENSKAYLNSYLTNQTQNSINKNASLANTANILSKIVKGISGADDLSFSYPLNNLSKTIKVTFVDNHSEDVVVTFDTTGQDLTKLKITQNKQFLLQEKVIYILSLEAKINQFEIQNISIESKDVYYNGKGQTVLVSFDNTPDNISLILDYSGEENAINVGRYIVSIASIIGDNAEFYKLPESYQTGTLNILSPTFSFALKNGTKTSFVFNEQQQSPEVEVVCVSGNFVLNSSEYSISFVGTGETVYDSEIAPTDAGSYKVQLKLLNKNLTIKGQDSYAFIIHVSQVEGKQNLDLDLVVSNKEYDGQEISFQVKNKGEILDSSLYTVAFFKGRTQIFETPKNAGNYSIVISPIDTESYEFFNNSKTFSITKKNIEIVEGKNRFAYDRTEKIIELSLNGVVEGDEVYLALEVDNSTVLPVSAGKYAVTSISLSGQQAENYNLVVEKEYSFQIQKVSEIVTISNTKIDYKNGQTITLSDLGLSFSNNNIMLQDSDYQISGLESQVGNYSLIITMLNSSIELNVLSLDYEIVKINITNINLLDKTFSYDGLEHSLTLDNTTLLDGTTCDFTFENNSRVEVGEQTVSCTITNKNYNTLVLTATLKIETNKKEIEFVGSTFVYNKQAQGLVVKSFDNQTLDSLVEITYTNLSDNSTSNSLPISAGSYEIKVRSLDETKLQLLGELVKNFEIERREVSINLSTQYKTYSKTQTKFDVITSSIVSGDDVHFILTYNGSTNVPINAGEYVVNVVEITGESSKNYVLAQNITGLLVINKLDVTVVAQDKESVFGDQDLKLTYNAFGLLSGDELSGELKRESGEDVGIYQIKLGTLNNENYNIIFVEAIYSITKREIIISCQEFEFEYSGEEISPTITISNLLAKDKDILVKNVVGDSTNVGTFTIRYSLLSNNYKLSNTYHDLVFTITKKDVSNSIISLAVDSVKFNNQKYTPIAIIENDYDYVLEYYKNNSLVQNIFNAGNYKVKVVINEQNYAGEKTFDFVVEKGDYAVTLGEFVAYSNKIVAPFYSNATYIVNGVEQSSNIINNLQELASYEIVVRLNETDNYKQLQFNAVTISTTMSVQSFNLRVTEYGEFDVTKIMELRTLAQTHSLMNQEEKLQVTTKYFDLLQDYQNYLSSIDENIQELNGIEVSIISNIGMSILLLAIFGITKLIKRTLGV